MSATPESVSLGLGHQRDATKSPEVDLEGDLTLSETGHSTHPLAGRARSSTPWATIVVVVLYVALAVLLYGHMWRAGPSAAIQPGGDQISTIWFLKWVPYALLHGHNPFFSSYANVPFGVNLLTNTSVPLLGLVGAPLTLLSGPVVTYNVWCTLALAGSATAGYVFVRRWVAWRPAAFVGGLLYGFSPYEFAQAQGHLNLTFVVLPPLIMLAAHEVLVRQQGSARRWGVVLGLLLVGQYFISSEVLASTVVLTVIGAIVAAIIGRRALPTHVRPGAVGLGWAAGVAVVLLAYPVWFTLRGPQSIRGQIQLVPQAYRADLLGPVVPSHFVWLAPSSLIRTSDAFANSVTENGSYLGIVLLVILAVGVVALWRRSAPVRVAAICGAAAFVISLGGGLVIRHAPSAYDTGFPLPERLFTKLPLLSNTVPVRYSLYVVLFAGLVLALVLDRLRSNLIARTEDPTDLADASGATDPTIPHASSATRPQTSGRHPGRHTRRRRPGAALIAAGVPLVLAALCLVPVAPNELLAGFAPVMVPPVFTSSTSPLPTSGTTLLYPYPSTTTPQGQLWQAVGGMRFRTPGGYFLVPDGASRTIGFSTAVGYGADTLTARTLIALYAGHPPSETPSLRAALRAQLQGWGVTSVVEAVTPGPGRAQGEAFLGWLTGTQSTPEQGSIVWKHVTFG